MRKVLRTLFMAGLAIGLASPGLSNAQMEIQTMQALCLL